MGDRRAVATSAAPAPVGPYSQAIAAGGVLYCSGQIALDAATGALDAGGAALQTRRCLSNLEIVAHAGGGALVEAARLTVYVVDLDENGVEVNDAYEHFFAMAPGPAPARVTVGVAALPKGALVEIDAVVPVEDPSPTLKGRGGIAEADLT